MIGATPVLLLLAGTIVAAGMLVIYRHKLCWAIATTPQVQPFPDTNKPLPSLAIIIPAYNEAGVIEACVVAALNATDWGSDRLEVWVVDDQSTDETLATVRSLQSTLGDPRLHILAGQPRPTTDIWQGKNWACAQAAKQTTMQMLLFLDADVQLQPGSVAAALSTVEQENLDLLTCTLAIRCGCLAEWLVQPVLLSLLAVGINAPAVNDPQAKAVFANGQFMLFRRSTYEVLGGHAAVADQVVEDVEFARLVKRKGKRLKYSLGHHLGSVQMYRSWPALWEGWSKNLYLGGGRNLSGTLYAAMVVFMIGCVPWIALVTLSGKAMLARLTGLETGLLLLAFVQVAVHYHLRQLGRSLLTLPPRYWWLTGLGSALTAALFLGSIIKTETGWGWTWRGRSLTLPQAHQR